MEAKKLMVGDIGPATGCAWSTVWPYDAAKEPSWATRLHRKFTDVLRKGEYCGPFDLNCIVTADAMYTLEPTPRFGYAAIQNFVELWNVPVGETLMALASGTLERLDVETDLLVAAVVLSIPPYPNASKAHRAPGDVPVLIDEGDMQRLWPSGLRYDSDTDQYLSAPTFGLVGTLVAHGTTLGRAVAKLLASASRVRIPNLQYRNDIGEGNEGKWQQLADWGYDLPPTAAKMVQRATQAPTRRPSGLGRMARA
jgi:phosphoribosylamine-glycine ligase